MISEPLNFPTLLSFNSIKTFKTKLNGIQWHSSNTVHFKQITFKTDIISLHLLDTVNRLLHGRPSEAQEMESYYCVVAF